MDYFITTEYIVKPVTACKIIKNCSGCGRKEKFVSTGNFRVNANGNRIDIWLIYQCEKCKHTYNLTVYERIRPGKIPKELYLAFLANDEETALRYGTDKELFSRNKAEADWDGLEYVIEQVGENIDFNRSESGQKVGERSVQSYLWNRDDEDKERLVIHNPYGIPIRADKILAEILGQSRTQVKKLLKEEKIVTVEYYSV